MADESIGIIRCEVDDQTAEDLAYALERLRSVPGVRDVCYWTAVGKRGRMMAAIQILCEPDVLHQAAEACLNETSTIGVRTAIEARCVLPRVMHVTQVDGRPVAIKRVTRPGGGRRPRSSSHHSLKAAVILPSEPGSNAWLRITLWRNPRE